MPMKHASGRPPEGPAPEGYEWRMEDGQWIMFPIDPPGGRPPEGPAPEGYEWRVVDGQWIMFPIDPPGRRNKKTGCLLLLAGFLFVGTAFFLDISKAASIAIGGVFIVTGIASLVRGKSVVS